MIREVAQPPSALDVLLHPDLVLLSQCDRRLYGAVDLRGLQRGVFRSLVELQAAIYRYLGEYNHKPNLRWTTDPDRIVQKLSRREYSIVGVTPFLTSEGCASLP